jgi:branched-chain amino acid transport system substrate-binding protein
MHGVFPDQDPYAQTIFPVACYDSVQAALQALEQVRGERSGGERRFRPALATVRLDGPGIGKIRLDANCQAVAAGRLVQDQRTGRRVIQQAIRVIPNVDRRSGGYFRLNSPPATPRGSALPSRQPAAVARSG